MNTKGSELAMNIEQCYHQTPLTAEEEKSYFIGASPNLMNLLSSKSRKNKLNAFSSTEQDLIGLDPSLEQEILDSRKEKFEKDDDHKVDSWTSLIDKEIAAVKQRAKLMDDIDKLRSLRLSSRSELNNINFKTRHYPGYSHENQMNDNTVRTHKDTLGLRNKSPTLCNKINGLIEIQHQDLKTWVREDENVTHFQTTEADGPDWGDVRLRQTFDARTGYMIEYLIVCSNVKDYERLLPPGVTHIKTIFRYESTKPVREVSSKSRLSKGKKHHNNNKAKTKKNKKKHSRFVEKDVKDYDCYPYTDDPNIPRID